ncbi:hypothetical protein DW248_16680, partial [Mediterraneibacter gnavus]
MAKIQRAFRLSQEAIDVIDQRDRQRYPTGQGLVEALLLNQEEKSEPTIETVLEELKKLNEKIEKILSEQLQEKSESNEKKEIPKMYGGLPYTPPPSDI